MKYLNISSLTKNKSILYNQWHDPKKPFRYLIFDDVLVSEKAEAILNEYPNITQGEWDGTTYINQKNKFTKTVFGDDYPNLKELFTELNSNEFLDFLSTITNIENLKADEDLFGGGLHQSTNGAFLNVHVDFNIHEKTKFHRRMNAIIYMNKDWKKEYNGYLELWDMKTKKQIEDIAPIFNRLVIFETNEVSFHGHPKPLNTPAGVSRKSLALYYYTQNRPIQDIVAEHNTIYVNTEGRKGMIKILRSGLKAMVERLKNKLH